MDDATFITHLQEWHARNKANPRIWSTPIGAKIKQILTNSGNFKNKKRGNASKGFQIMVENRRREAAGLLPLPRPERKKRAPKQNKLDSGQQILKNYVPDW